MIDPAPDPNLAGPLLEAALRVSDAPVIAWDLDGRVLATNEAFCALLGYTAAEARGLRREALFHPDDRRALDGRMGADGRTVRTSRTTRAASGPQTSE